ncbi:GNAT family N-acetyltransferase [Saccharobesus litoralis]|uniref:GNAT family N-acetyltransferase n=1 Tax=Saccharobesus litoralis TaxID=2172099 RepID=A0A2S0VUS8_9ALTE|nr:GNAT family N-acetyltransferase [Saccharobesus litoralis]AWB67922.1 GNAT family N-acetyltransferase [Saccharobesus litoralis]
MTRIEHSSWQQIAKVIKDIRSTVFVYEWRIPRAVEFDEVDSVSDHVVLYDDELPVATGRLCPDGYLSRVAVIASRRKTNAADEVFKALAEIAQRKNFDVLTICADIAHVESCRKGGFQCSGRVFMEAGVPRQKLSCPVNRFQPVSWDWLH